MAIKQNDKQPNSQQMVAITKAYDLVREMSTRVDKLPRSRKFVFGDRILHNAYDVLDRLIEARYTRDKVELLDSANLALEKMRFQMRLAHDEKLASTHQYEVSCRLIDEVGRLVGGWRRSQGRAKPIFEAP